MKLWYQSKTLWTNIIFGILILVQYSTEQEWLPAAAQGLIIIVANMLLRVISGQPITFKSKE